MSFEVLKTILVIILTTGAFQKLYINAFLHRYSHTHFSIYDNAFLDTFHILCFIKWRLDMFLAVK